VGTGKLIGRKEVFFCFLNPLSCQSFHTERDLC
jgi:hypothetical protein